MESFRFKCITVSKTEIQKGIFIKAINKNGPVELFIYGKKTPVDNMNLIEVAGFYKHTSKEYFVVKHINILNRFPKNRESFSKLSTSLLMIEIAYKTKIGVELLLNGLTVLEDKSDKPAFIWFLVSFLLQNGIFNKSGFSKQELAVMNFILQSNSKSRLSLSDKEFNILSKKLIGYIEDYANTNFSSVKFTRSV